MFPGASEVCIDGQTEVTAADSKDVSENCPEEGQLEENSSQDTASRKTTLQMCLVQGGMDTEGEIFDDTLVMILP